MTKRESPITAKIPSRLVVSTIAEGMRQRITPKKIDPRTTLIPTGTYFWAIAIRTPKSMKKAPNQYRIFRCLIFSAAICTSPHALRATSFCCVPKTVWIETFVISAVFVIEKLNVVGSAAFSGCVITVRVLLILTVPGFCVGMRAELHPIMTKSEKHRKRLCAHSPARLIFLRFSFFIPVNLNTLHHCVDCCRNPSYSGDPLV